MNRRSMISAMAVASALPAVLTARSAQAAMPMMGEAEMKHDADTKMVGSLSLATSRVALKMADGPKVKEFAEFETAEQETVADILKSMEMAADKAEGALHPPTEAEVDAMLDAEGKKKLADLKGMSGKGFDKAYVTAQLEGHKKLLTIQEDYLKVGKDREHLSVAKLVRGQVKEHIKLLEDIQGMMG